MAPSPSARGMIALSSIRSHSKSSSCKPRSTSSEPSIEDYIPPYLRRVISPYHGDFCHTPLFHPRLLVQLMAEGFLPIATRGALLPKLHSERCVIPLPSALHVSKSVRKKSNKFTFSIDTQFSAVVRECHKQHDHCWLYPPLVEAMMFLSEKGGMDAVVGNPSKATRVRIVSIEVFHQNQLVAGELGYTVGSMYTSMTGFSKMDSAGSVQLAALGRLLIQQGFTMWDLGMDMDYKQRLGSMLMKRAEFVKHVHATRHATHVVLPSSTLVDKISCRTLIDGDLASLCPKRKSDPKPQPPKRRKSEVQQQQQSFTC